MQKKDENKGFTLVEIIVVVVILAIVVGASIIGVQTYVKQSKLNTDITNCKTIKEVMTGIEDEPVFYRKLVQLTQENATTVLATNWGRDRQGVSYDNIAVTKSSSTVTPELQTLMTDYMKQVFKDGLPAPKSKGEFYLVIGLKKDSDRQFKMKVDCLFISRNNTIKYSDDETRYDEAFLVDDVDSYIQW